MCTSVATPLQENFLLEAKEETLQLTRFQELPIVDVPLPVDSNGKDFQEENVSSGTTQPQTFSRTESEAKHFPSLQIISDFFADYPIAKSDYEPNLREKGKHECITSLEDILREFKTDHISFLGPAGSGKSTLLQHIAAQVNKQRYLEDVKLVVFANCQSFPRDEKVTAEKLFFGNLTNSGKLIEFTKANNRAVLFVIDSLDTLCFTPDGVFEEMDLPKDMSKCWYPEVLLCHLLSGSLFPGSRVITSSREYAMLNYFGKIRPLKVITFSGFQQDSMNCVITEHLGSEADKLKMFIESNPTLSSICTNPLLLKITISLWKTRMLKNKNTAYLTLTNLLSLQVTRYLKSRHVPGGNDDNTLIKLAELAYEGIKDGEVLFLPKHLKKIGLTNVAASYAGILVPARSVENKRSATYFFVHQCFQEILAALHVAMKLGDSFQQCLKDVNSKDHFMVVRSFLYGLLLGLNKKSSVFGRLLEGHQVPAKKDLLIESAKQMLLDIRSSRRRVEFFATLFEAGESIRNIVSGTIEEIRLENIRLSPLDMVNLARVLQCYDKVEALLLVNCNLTLHHVQALCAGMTASNPKITKIIASKNKSIKGGIKLLGVLARSVDTEELELCHCNIEADQLVELKESLKEKKLKFLILDDEIDVDDRLLAGVVSLLSNVEVNVSLTLWKMQPKHKQFIRWKHQNLSNCTAEITFNRYETLTNCGTHGQLLVVENQSSVVEEIKKHSHMNKELEELRLRNCSIGEKDLQLITDEVKDSKWKIRKITVCSTRGMKELVPAIFELFDKATATELNLENTDITASQLCSSKEEVHPMLINLSNNRNLGDYKLIGKILKRWDTRALVLKGCKLTEENIANLRSEVSQRKIEKLDVSYNPDIGAEGFRHIAYIIKGNKNVDLSMRGCNLNLSKWEAFVKEHDLETTIEKLDISYNPDIGAEGFRHIAYIIKGNKNVDLSMRACDLNLSKWEAFVEGLEPFIEEHDSETTIRRLDISYNEVNECLMMEVIEFAVSASVEELELNGCSLGEEEIRILYDNLKSLKITSLGLGDNCGIDASMKLIGEMIRSIKIKKVNLSNCMLSASVIPILLEGLEGAKISRLNLSDHKRTLTSGYAEALCQVVSHVEDCLELRFNVLPKFEREKIEKARPKALSLIF